jgi:Ca-activated chloride channel family protein
MALLLPLPWLIYLWRKPAEPNGAIVFVPMAMTLPADATQTAGASRVGRWIFAAIWLLLVAAAMRPQWLGEPQPIPTTGRRLMLAIDVSGSMATEDMAGGASRLRVVQQVAGQFIDSRHGDRVGLILFGTQPYLQAPLSADLTTVHDFLNEAVVGVAGTQTAIGDAIGLAIKRLRAQSDAGHPAPPGQTVLVLLTDGVNDAGAMPPLEAAKLAAQSGLRIYTIGVGAADDGGGFFGVGGGNSDLDEQTLQQIAKLTGGEYFRATDANALQAVYRQIDRLEPAAGTRQWLRPADEWFDWPLAAALLLSLPAAGMRRWT